MIGIPHFGTIKMCDKENLLFQIICEGQECTLEKHKYDTVGDLKEEIFQKFGVAVYKQIIECWNKIPENDSNTLISCCLPNECNFLIVYNIEHNDFKGRDTLSLHNYSQGNINNASEDNQDKSIFSFMQYFSSRFSTRGISFNICSLEDAFNDVSNTSQNKKILLLYLHNKNDIFARDFCQQLTKPEVQKIINKNVFLLGWDIEEISYHSSLIKALKNHEGLQHLSSYVKERMCCAIIVAPKQNSAFVSNILKGQISTEECLRILRNVTKYEDNSSETSDTEHHVFGSKEYQQLMLDFLGDRDYDSFDFYEFDHLKSKIGYSLYGPPKSKEYAEDEKKRIDSLFNVILQENNLVSKWKDRVIISFIYVCTEPLPGEKKKRAKKYENYDPDSDLTPVPVFVLRKCKHATNPCRVFIDDTGRVYQSWKSYLSENKLTKCEMIYPKDGRYSADPEGKVILERKLSPACDISNDILQATDIASAVGGIASGGLMMAAAAIPAVAAAPLVLPIAAGTGAALGIYSIARSAVTIHDRRIHKENMNFFESSEARGAYINIVAGSLGFVGTGANLALSQLAARGFDIGKGATAAVNTINIVNLGAGGVGVTNASYDVIRNWVCENETPSLLTIVQLSSSILFFGHAVYNFKSVSTVIEESQANALREYQDSLRSNRHRKTFIKLLKESIRQNDGNVQKGQAEVISTIKNIQNKDEVFATLTRANKNMNKNNVRFAANNGEITLNGVAVDMVKFGNMEKTDAITFLTQLPNRPNPSSADVRTMSTFIQSNFEGMSYIEIAGLALNVVQFFGSTDTTIKQKVIKAVAAVIKYLLGHPRNYMEILDRIFPNHDKYFRIFTMASGFFQSLINKVEDQYTRWKETQDPQYEEPYFIRLSLDKSKRIIEIFNKVTEMYYIGTDLTQFGLEQLLDYFYTWFAREVYNFEERLNRRQRRCEHSTKKPKQNCCTCGGYYYC